MPISELRVQALLEEVDAGAVDQRQAVGIDEDAHAVLLEHGVAVTLLAGQVGPVAPARAAGALDAEAQADRRIVAGQDTLDAFPGSGCTMDRHRVHFSRSASWQLTCSS